MSVLTDMMPWLSDVGRYALMGLGAMTALAVLWFAGKFVRFWRTAR